MEYTLEEGSQSFLSVNLLEHVKCTGVLALGLEPCLDGNVGIYNIVN